MDWTPCVACQQKTAEVLKCSLKAAHARGKSETYASFLNNVNEFRDLNQLPVELNFDGVMDVDQLVRQEAKWHKCYHIKIKLQ